MLDSIILEKITSPNDDEVFLALNKICALKEILFDEAEALSLLLVPYLKSKNPILNTYAKEAFNRIKRLQPKVQIPPEMFDNAFGWENGTIQAENTLPSVMPSLTQEPTHRQGLYSEIKSRFSVMKRLGLFIFVLFIAMSCGLFIKWTQKTQGTKEAHEGSLFAPLATATTPAQDVNTQVKCQDCDGRGECKFCAGCGIDPGDSLFRKAKCRSCNGKTRCKSCLGKGFTWKDVTGSNGTEASQKPQEEANPWPMFSGELDR